MKILFIGCKYDYGNPELGFSFEYYNIYESLVKMNNGANDVVFFPFDQIMINAGRDQMNQQLLEKVEKEKPDLCFFFLLGNEIKKETVAQITQKSGSVTINWFADDTWRFDNFSKYWVPYFTWVITDQPRAIKKYYKTGYKNVIYGPFAFNQFSYKSEHLPKMYDVSFVGQPHGNRKKIIAELKKVGIKVECFGRGWSNGKVSQEEMIKIFCQSKINLNFTKCSGSFNIRNFAKIFIEKKYDGSFNISSPKNWFGNFRSFLAAIGRYELKGRNYEIPGCGSFLLTEYAPGLEKFYDIEKEVVCFYGAKDLAKKIIYFLENEKEREGIALAGYRRTMQEHTYEKRFNDIFKTIGFKI